MTKKDLAKILKKSFPDVDDDIILELIEAFFEVLIEALQNGQAIELRGFGILEPRVGKGAWFFNPKNQQKYFIKEKRRVLFKNSKELLERLNTPFEAGLDLGTQTFRLILGKFFNGQPLFLWRGRENVRLGENLKDRGFLGEEAIKRGLTALGKFKSFLNKYEVKRINAVGTAVFRQAKNGESFLREVEEKLGISIRILSPEEEAKLTLKGVEFGLKILGLNLDHFLVVDVGGGSTEIINYKKDGTPEIFSLDLGVVFLRDLFKLKYPITSRVFQSLREYVRERTKELSFRASPFMIVTGGSASLLGAIDLKLKDFDFDLLHGHRLTWDRLIKLSERVIGLTYSQLAKLKGMERGREDLLIPALAIYLELLNYFSLSEVIISEFGILEATLLSFWGL